MAYAAVRRHSLEPLEKVLRADANYFTSLAGLDAEVAPQPAEPGHRKYVVSLAVSDVQQAGTRQALAVAITGTRGSSEELILNRPLLDSLSRASTLTLTVDLPDLGEPLTVDVALGTQIATDALHLSYVAIVDVADKTVSLFPGHRWISGGKVTLRNGAATLATRETHVMLINHREQELAERQRVYRWGKNPRYRGFPGYLDAERHEDLPLEAQFADVRSHNIPRNVAKAAVRFGLSALLGVQRHFARFQDFVEITNGLDKQSDHELLTYISNNWTRDEEFGRQYLCGHNPGVLRRCTAWPSSLDRSAVLAQLAGDINIDAEMQEGRIYIADYAMLDGLHQHGADGGHDERPTGDYCAPVCLMRVLRHPGGGGSLVPFVIQLGQRPGGASGPLWTPRDGLGWLLAKVYVRSADAQLHELDAHLLRTHLVAEAFAVATLRCLPSSHPVHKLIAPHLRSTVAINAKARETLLNDGGVVQRTLAIGGAGSYELVRRAYRRLSVARDLNFPAELRARGVDDAAALPGYYYRDDGLRLWAALDEYAERTLDAHYSSDADVSADSELQAWMAELHDEGFAAWDDGDSAAAAAAAAAEVESAETEVAAAAAAAAAEEAHGLPRSLDSRRQLVELVTGVLFTGSAAHAAVNFSQLAHYGFVPNAPMLMRRPPPTDRGAVSLQVLCESLPWQSDAVNQLLISYVLTRYSDAETFIGKYSEVYFTEATALDALDRLRAQLDQLAAEIQMRNRMLRSRGEMGYSHMSPHLVPNSIAI